MLPPVPPSDDDSSDEEKEHGVAPGALQMPMAAGGMPGPATFGGAACDGGGQPAPAGPWVANTASFGGPWAPPPWAPPPSGRGAKAQGPQQPAPPGMDPLALAQMQWQAEMVRAVRKLAKKGGGKGDSKKGDKGDGGDGQ